MNHEKNIKKAIEIESLVSLFDAHYRGSFNFPGEFHPFWELVYVKDGLVNVSGDEKIYLLQKGDIIFHKPMEFHRIWSADGNDIRVFISAFRAGGTAISKLEELATPLTTKQTEIIEKLTEFTKKHFPEEHGQFHQTMFEHWSDESESIQTVINLMEILLLSVSKQGSIAMRTTDKSGVSEIYREIISKLNENVYGQITLSQLAEQCSFSVSQIKRVFAKYSDIGIHKYFIKLKIAMSIRMLGKGMSISKISDSLSFSNQNYFSSAFKRETGLSPSEYKKRILGIMN